MQLQALFIAGGWVMWPLLGCSIITLMVTIERSIFWVYQYLLLPSAIRSQLRCPHALQAVPPRHYLACLVNLDQNATPLSDVYLTMLAQRTLLKLKKGMPILETVVTIAPILGILGTVTGIIGAFEALSMASVNDPKLISHGISEALITTAFGLIIGLFAQVALNYYIVRIEKATWQFNQIIAYYSSMEQG